MPFTSHDSYDDELAGDVRSQYIDALRRGKDGLEATKQLVDDYAPALMDEEDAPVFWFALADVQWNMGRLEETVKQHALAHIEKELESIGTQASATHHVNALTALQQKLLSPQPQKKKIKQYCLYHTDWKVGDVFAYRLNGEGADDTALHDMYVYFVVKGTDTWYPGHIIPVVYVYWVVSKELLSLAQLQKYAYLPQFYTPVAYQNHPGMKRMYSLALLCTSARVIPKKKIIFLGNIGSVKAVENEDASAYPIAWKKFDRYMMENYMTWNKTNAPVEPH